MIIMPHGRPGHRSSSQARQTSGTPQVAVVVLALLAASARDRVQRWVDRLLFGYRKDPYAVVSRVGQRRLWCGPPVQPEDLCWPLAAAGIKSIYRFSGHAGGRVSRPYDWAGKR